MATAKSFEDLFVWQKARELSQLIYRFTNNSKFSQDRGLVDQIRRAAVSVLSNIAEGFERGSKKEVIYFLFIAKASCGEVRAQLYVAFDQRYINERELREAAELAKYVSALISRFIESLKVSKFKGLKFKATEDKGQKELRELINKYLPSDHPSLNT